MRLGIDYRLLASRENLVNRGIGRYTQQQLRHVLELDGENEYLLLCPPGSDIDLVLPEIRVAPNVSFRFGPSPGSPAPLDPYERRGLLRRSAEYQDWIHGLGVDLYHSTAPFVLEQTAPPAFEACPMVATVYDFIPLVFPAAYLVDPGRRAAYAGAARLVRSATRLIAISDGTRDDAVHYLGVARAAIDCATPFADACFAPMDAGAVSAALDGLARRLGLPERFVLTVAALHHTKNLELLFAAYARLSAAFRRALPLVVACHLDDLGAAHVRWWAGTFGVADDVVITGYVSDAELAALYNRATLVVHPSRYEGFGLPVVEAMQCGAAVITTTAPSLPEIVAGAAVLVGPDDAAGLAAAIEGLAGDPAAREQMGEKGIARAAVFTPEALASNTLASYRAALAASAADDGRRRAAVWAPAAVATSLDIVPVLPGDWDVEVFTSDDDEALPEALLDHAAVHHHSALVRMHLTRPFDVVLVTDEVERRRVQEGRIDATVMVAPLAVADPCHGRPGLEPVLARGRLGWAPGRLVVAVLGADEDGRLLAGTDGVVVVGAGADELLACDAVVSLSPATQTRDIVRAVAAGTPVLLGGPRGEFDWPATFCEQVHVGDVAARLVELAGNLDEVRRRSAAARAWFEGHASLACAARSYRDLLDLEPSPSDVGVNKLCEVEDFESPALVDAFDALGLDGTGTIAWSAAMAVLGLATAGGGGRVLALGEQSVPVALHLTRAAGQVTLAGPWLHGGGSPRWRALLLDPTLLASRSFEPDRLVVRPANLISLPFGDASFDAVVACLAVEGLTADDVATAIAGMRRVVRPGGVVALSLGVRIHGPEGSPGIALDRVVAELLPASGLMPVDPVQTEVSARTMRGRRDFAWAVGGAAAVDGGPPLSIFQGALLGCLHLTLRRPVGQDVG